MDFFVLDVTAIAENIHLLRTVYDVKTLSIINYIAEYYKEKALNAIKSILSKWSKYAAVFWVN